jgi:hypothetical protein
MRLSTKRSVISEGFLFAACEYCNNILRECALYTAFLLLSKYCILFCLSKRKNSFVLIVCLFIKLIAKSEYRRPYSDYVKGGGSGIQTPAVTRDFIFSTTVQTGYSVHTVFYSRGTGFSRE